MFRRLLSVTQTVEMAVARGAELADLVMRSGRPARENVRRSATLRAQLAASRRAATRMVSAGLEDRRRLERSLHDGAQQRLLGVGLRLGALQAGVHEPGTVRELHLIRGELRVALRELRDLADGIYPAVLTQAGLGAALEVVVEGLGIQVGLDVPCQRWPADVESAAYLVVCHTLGRAAQHPAGGRVTVTVAQARDRLLVEVCDPGGGDAWLHRPRALPHLRDRVAALDGELTVRSWPGAGTRVTASLPCG